MGECDGCGKTRWVQRWDYLAKGGVLIDIWLCQECNGEEDGEPVTGHPLEGLDPSR